MGQGRWLQLLGSIRRLPGEPTYAQRRTLSLDKTSAVNSPGIWPRSRGCRLRPSVPWLALPPDDLADPGLSLLEPLGGPPPEGATLHLNRLDICNTIVLERLPGAKISDSSHR